MIAYSDKTVLYCSKDSTGIITIPNGIEIISPNAFKDCSEILKIILPNTINKISPGAFANCTALEHINIPESVQEIPNNCFSGCMSMQKIGLPSHLYRIGSNAFENCQSLTSLSLPNSIQKIDTNAFKDCSSLNRIIIPNNITNIASGTFSGCESLTEINIPPNIQSIDTNAFANCIGLYCVIIESDNIDIDPTAFIKCDNLTKVYLKDFKPIRILSSFPDCSHIKYIAPLEDYTTGLSKQCVSLNTVQEKLSNELKYMSLYYRLFNMNITQMKWSECPKKNNKSFKEPIDLDWEKYKVCDQSLDYLFSLNWEHSSGIGLVLGYNQYRALDVDILGWILLFEQEYPDGLDGFINEILTFLHLPLNYPWVVRSGNGYGFHIIFKCEDYEVTQNIDSLSFEANDQYRFDYEIPYFRRMELRWCDHLVLPPSLHVSGLQYKFRNNSLPTISPSEINLKDIDTMINNYCGERIFRNASYKGIKIELTEISKIKNRHDSYLSPHEHQLNTIEWLTKTSSDESKNSLAIYYLLDDNKSETTSLAINYLKESKSQSAKFNLLQLYACGLIQYDSSIYNELYYSLDTQLFKNHLEILKCNANLYLPKTELYLFLDTETTGLPENYNAATTDIQNWPRLVQFSWIVTDNFQNILAKHNHIIKPNNYIIPDDSVAIHGITTEYAKTHGKDLTEVLFAFIEDLKKVKYIIGHNIDFDKKIIQAECFRTNTILPWNEKISICTMKSAVNFCKIQNYYGYRYPKLQELYKKLFGVEFNNAHDSSSDILATLKCFWEMIKKGIITIPQENSYQNNIDDELPF